VQYNRPLNLTGMSQKERKAYSLWLLSEEQNLRRARNPTRKEEALKYHNALNRLCNNLLKQKD